MITPLSHPVGGIELLLTNLRVIIECLVLVCLLGPSHLRLVARHASISLRHAVNVLAVQEVVHDLVAVLVAWTSLAVVGTQHGDALICLVQALRYDNWTCFADRGMLHLVLYAASMLPLDTETGHSGSLLMIEVYLLLPRVCESGHSNSRSRLV